MSKVKTYTVNPGWRILLLDAGINPGNVLRRAALPADLFARERATIETEEYFRLWQALEDETGNSLAGLHIGQAISVEAFDPPIFASFCSPDLNTALQRLARFKPLIGPMHMHVDIGSKKTTMELQWLDASARPPSSLVAGELTFFVQLARLATRVRICPLEVRSPIALEPAAAYSEYLGVPVRKGKNVRHVFRAEDAARPFLTANPTMWEFFEPSLQQRLTELDETATTVDRVRAVLLEMLPGGGASMAAVAKNLGTSTRTLQRRLKQEGQSFQSVLNQTREELASHYLKSTNLPGAEISYLLGYEDPNCFFRAYHTWTGTTPAKARAELQAAV